MKDNITNFDLFQDLRGRTPLDLANAQLREVLHAEIRPNESRRQSTVSTLSCPRLYSQSRRQEGTMGENVLNIKH